MAAPAPEGPNPDPDDIIQSRAPGNNYNPANTERANLLLITGISDKYEDQINDIDNHNIHPSRSLDWIISNNFYIGAHSIAERFTHPGANPRFRQVFTTEINHGIFEDAAAEFLQFMEIKIQRWLYETSKQLLHEDRIDRASFDYCQRLICQPRDRVNQTLRQLFYHFYNGTGNIRLLNEVQWYGDIKIIINEIIGLIRRTFSTVEDDSRFLSMIPHLQFAVGGLNNHRWTWELRGSKFLTLLFALVMIRLPTKDVSEADGRVNLFVRFLFYNSEEERMELKNISVFLMDPNTNHLFYFVPEQNIVFGIWPKSVRVKNDSMAPSHQLNINYKANLLRSNVVKLLIPATRTYDNLSLAIDFLFSDPVNNIYRTLRERNPFQLDALRNPVTRLYVSLTIYTEDGSLLHIPYVLEGSLTNGLPFDVSEFCNEFDRVIANTASGQMADFRGLDYKLFYFHFSMIHDPNLPLSRLPGGPAAIAAEQPRVRQRVNSGIAHRPVTRSQSRASTAGMLAGAPYAGTKKEKHYLIGSLINRFTQSAALFKTPIKRMNSCLMMSLMRAQMYQYVFNSTTKKCTDILVTGTSCESVKSDYMYVQCITNFDNIPRAFPFLEKINGNWFVRMFNPSKWKINEKFIAGCRDELEEEFWEMAAEEIWFQLQVHFEKNLDYTSLSEYGQAFSDFFKVCISIYDVEVRCNRVHVITPDQKTPKQLVEENGNILMIHIVFDQGHIHPVSSFPAFVKNEGRKDELRLYNYCPICDEKQKVDLRKNKQSAMDHISDCLCKDFKIGYEDELDKQLATQPGEVSKIFKKVRGKNVPCFKCNQCGEEITQHGYMNHHCYVPTKKLETINNENIYVYDLECSQTLDEFGLYRHECNCLMIRKVYPTNDEEKNGRYFPSEIEFVEAIISENEFQNALFIAFNGGSYDIHFLLRIFERGEITHTYVPSPTSKHKFIQILLTEKNIKFIDFMRFIPGSLKQIAEAFEIPVSKGDFPHKFNNGDHDEYIGAIPPLRTEEDYWGLSQFRNEKARDKFIEWYNEQSTTIYCSCENFSDTCCTKLKWNFQNEIKKYCLMDVIVLAEIVRHYREACMSFDGQGEKIMNWTVPRFDPLQFMTLPQITMQTLVHGFSTFESDEYDFKGISTFYKKFRGGQSWEAIVWVMLESNKRGLTDVYHLGNSCKEYYDFETNLSLDGYSPSSSTVFWFLKCSYWGCTLCMQEHNEFNWILPDRGMYCSDVRQHYESCLTKLEQTYRKVITIWDHEFNCSLMDPYLLKCCQVMRPEECFYGGRTEVFQLYSNARKLGKDIHYYDVTSLYPSVYAHHPLPIGHPTHILGFQIDRSRFHPTASNRYYGYARIKVVPNKSDLIGLLPQRDQKSGRLYFPVYPMEGCWGTEEIYLAMQNGYTVEEIYELYYWDERNYSNLHFAAYVNYFFQLKQEAEGWVKLGASCENPSEEEQNEIVERLYRQNGNLARIRPNMVRKNAVLRSLAKLYLNSLWGKFAQKSSKTQHTTIYGTQQFLALWNNKKIDQSKCFFREISPGVYKTSYNLKNEFVNPVRHGNLFIAAKVTETARCVLHKKMLQVGPENIIYCDTDSIIFLYNQLMGILTDVGLGKWTNEYPSHVIEHVYALAPKLYSLKLSQNDNSKEVFRAKGIQMTIENQQKMIFDAIKPLITNLITGKDSHFTIPVKNFTIFSNSGNSALPYGQVFSRYNEKKVRAIITKRIFQVQEVIDWDICEQIRTYPIGYEF